MSTPQTRDFPDAVYRVGRVRGPLHYNKINPLDAELADVGYRFDVVGGGVMYCSTDKVGAFKESLADFRPAASSFEYEEEHLQRVGSVPASWRQGRLMAKFGLANPLPFLDVEQDETLTHLTAELADDLRQLGIERLDSSNVRGPNRLLTRLLARWAYTQVDEEDEATYSGIRYSSRFQSHECWAVFDGVQIGTTTTAGIDREDPDLIAVAREFAVTVH